MEKESEVTVYQGQQKMESDRSQIVEQRSPLRLDQLVAVWLDAKGKRTNSQKTRKAYQETIEQFRGLLRSSGLDLDSDAVTVATLAQGWAASRVGGGIVSASTYNQRLAILSSFYIFALKRDVLARNPIDLVERRPVESKDAAMPLEMEEVVARLQAIDRETQEGARDYALLSVLLATGRRVSELANLRRGDIHFVGKKAIVIWKRCKGGKVMNDELPAQTTQALRSYLHKIYGATVEQMVADTPVWVSFSRQNYGRAIGIQTIADICERRLGTSKVHTTRHTFAVMMEQAGAKLSDIGARLGHSDLKTTSDYMKRLHSAENTYADSLEKMMGME